MQKVKRRERMSVKTNVKVSNNLSTSKLFLWMINISDTNIDRYSKKKKEKKNNYLYIKAYTKHTSLFLSIYIYAYIYIYIYTDRLTYMCMQITDYKTITDYDTDR